SWESRLFSCHHNYTIMRNYSILLFASFLFPSFLFCQGVGVGTTVPDASAQIDISSPAKGILIPRMSTASIASISNPAKGLLVYDSVKNQLMVNMGTPSTPDWQTIVAKSGWNLGGNAGTNPPTEFIGTTDAKPFIIKVKNIQAGLVDTASQNTGLGFRNLESITSAINNVAVGYKALITDSSGVDNTALCSNTLRFTTSGSSNTAVGMLSQQLNQTGTMNASTGAYSLNRNLTGTGNTAMGSSALYWNTANYNSAVGFESLNQNTIGFGNTAL